MKFITPFLFLLVIAFAFAIPQKITNNDYEVQKNNTETDETPQKINEPSNKCKIEQEKISECYPSLDNYKNNYKEICPPIKTENCQNVYKDPKSFLPSCDDISSYEDFNYINNVNLLCQLDENKELCPLVKSFYNNESYSDRDTCNSKICTDSMIAFLENLETQYKNSNTLDLMTMISSNKRNRDIKDSIEYYKSDRCITQYTNDGMSLKVGTTFIVTLGLLLLSLY